MQTDQSPSREVVALREHFIAIVTEAIHDHDADREADSGRLAHDHAIHAVTRILALLTPAPQPATVEVKVEQRHA